MPTTCRRVPMPGQPGSEPSPRTLSPAPIRARPTAAQRRSCHQVDLSNGRRARRRSRRAQGLRAPTVRPRRPAPDRASVHPNHLGPAPVTTKRNVRPAAPPPRGGRTASAEPGVSGPRNHTGSAPSRETSSRATPQVARTRTAGLPDRGLLDRSLGPAAPEAPSAAATALLSRQGMACAGPESPTRSGTRSRCPHRPSHRR